MVHLGRFGILSGKSTEQGVAMSRFVFTKESLDWCFNTMSEFASQFHSSQPQSELTGNTPVYNAMADAIEWLDERPHGFSSNGALRQLYVALLNARTTVILNEDLNGFCTFWQIALKKIFSRLSTLKTKFKS